MSKYTTELRYICESLAGLTESAGYDDIDSILSACRSKIFSFDYPIFDEAYRSAIETKILKHFYTREIGLETYGLWKLKLDTKMNEIMPLYNLYYESALIKFNPIYTKDLHRKKDVEIDTTDNTIASQETSSTIDRDISNTGTESENIIGSRSIDSSNDVDSTVGDVGNENGQSNVESVNRDLYSDTPQGALTGVENQTYLTNARKITNESESGYSVDKTNTRTIDTTETEDTDETNSSSRANNITNNGSEDVESGSTSSTEQSKAGNSVEDYLEHVYGYENGSASKLLKEYRETFLNIDMMVINDLEELFMQLW